MLLLERPPPITITVDQNLMSHLKQLLLINIIYSCSNHYNLLDYGGHQRQNIENNKTEDKIIPSCSSSSRSPINPEQWKFISLVHGNNYSFQLLWSEYANWYSFIRLLKRGKNIFLAKKKIRKNNNKKCITLNTKWFLNHVSGKYYGATI